MLYSISKTNWGNKKGTHKGEQERHSENEWEKKKRFLCKGGLFLSIKILKETTTPSKQWLNITPEKKI